MALVKLNNRAVKDITSLGVGTGDLVFISKQTASSDASISFTSGIDSSYKEYIFKFVNIHPASDGALFYVNFSTDAGSNYGVTKTTTVFRARHSESGATADLVYRTGADRAQSTVKQTLTDNIGSDNDQSFSGFLHLFNPSSTTFVKHFIANTNTAYSEDYSINLNIAGYCNTTSAVDAIQFSMSSGNIDSGDILLYGVN